MSSRFLKYSLVIFSLYILVFNSCKKDTSSGIDSSVVNDYCTAENESDRIIDAVNSAAFAAKLVRLNEVTDTAYSILPACDTIVVDSALGTKTMVIMFDTLGCVCTKWDGQTRKGNITATWTGKFTDPGTVITITTQNYYVNSAKFDYTQTVTNKGMNNAGNLTYQVNVSSAFVTFTNAKTISWTSTRTREWLNSTNTLTPLNNQYSITGAAQGVDRNGTAFTETVTTPLIVKTGCQWIEKGVVAITPSGSAVYSVDFGDGACDSQATATINGIAYNIAL